VSRQSAAENIARPTAELAAREARLSDRRIRAQKVDAVLKLAETRQEVAADARKRLEKLVGQGLLSLDKRTAAVESEFRSLQDLEALKAEKRAVEGEINTLQIAVREAGVALGDLRHLYDDGQMRVPIDGIVS